jgi:putative transposase
MKKSAYTKSGREEKTVQLRFAALQSPQETLHGLIHEAGIRALGAMLEEERTALCGGRCARIPGRRNVRGGHASGELPYGGRLVRLARPRVRSVEGREVALPSWEAFSNQDPLTERAMEQMVLGVATRKYKRSLGPEAASLPSRGTSKSAVSRRFIAETTKVLGAMMGRDLSGLSLCAVMIDGIHMGKHVVLVAMGIDACGKKHILGIYEGATENTAVCSGLLNDLEGRGLCTTASMLFAIDGGKGLHRAIREKFGKHALIQRCQVHKKRNVTDLLPKEMRASVGRTISLAYKSQSRVRAKKILEGLARQLEHKHPSAAASLREGLDETLTVLDFGLEPALVKTLCSTNPLEFINSRIRDITHNVDKWQSGDMVLRWAAVALVEAAKTFRRVRGYAGLPKLVRALKAHGDALSQKQNPAVDAPAKIAS